MRYRHGLHVDLLGDDLVRESSDVLVDVPRLLQDRLEGLAGHGDAAENRSTHVLVLVLRQQPEVNVDDGALRILRLLQSPHPEHGLGSDEVGEVANPLEHHVVDVVEEDAVDLRSFAEVREEHVDGLTAPETNGLGGRSVMLG